MIASTVSTGELKRTYPDYVTVMLFSIIVGTGAKIAELKMMRLAVFRSNCHIYAQLFSGCGTQVLATASTAETGLRQQMPNGGNVEAAKAVGKLIAERAKAKGIDEVAFDRSGFRYHGRIRALAEAARDGGLKF